MIKQKIMRNIKILGIGSSKYRELVRNLTKAIKELNLEVEVEQFEEVEDFFRFNIVKIPALMIDNQIVIKGYVPSVEELKVILESSITLSLND
jgi:small redox-active disulfide protein 2